MKTLRVVTFTGPLALALACGTAPDDSEERVELAAHGCQNNVPEYYDAASGEWVHCVYTSEPAPPPSVDPCLSFPSLCTWEPPDPPDPPDPCAQDPSACSAGELPLCTPNGDVPADLQAQVDDRVESCFQQDWSKLAFVEQTDSVNYSPGSGGVLPSIADWLTNNITTCVIQNIDWMFYSGSAGGQIMQGLTNRLNTQAAAKNLTPHQRICSAMCVSGKLITYSMDNLSTVLPSSAVTAGVGVCREFAQIGTRLLTGMGFSAHAVGSLATQHAFVKVTSPQGGSFYVEPQTSKCIFYNRH